MGYSKLFDTIVTSTVWSGTPSSLKVVWITILATKDAEGIVHCTLPGLAKLAEVSLEACADAIRVLEAPDTLSRTKAFDGRRIEPVEDGWRVLNHFAYRNRLSAEDRKAARARQQQIRRQRERDLQREA